jgi:hypothetical protein
MTRAAPDALSTRVKSTASWLITRAVKAVGTATPSSPRRAWPPAAAPGRRRPDAVPEGSGWRGTLAACRDALGDAVYTDSWRSGESAPAERAVDAALAELEHPAA